MAVSTNESGEASVTSSNRGGRAKPARYINIGVVDANGKNRQLGSVGLQAGTVVHKAFMAWQDSLPEEDRDAETQQRLTITVRDALDDNDVVF